MAQLIKIPEFVLFDIVTKALKFLREDYALQTDKSTTFLSRVLAGNSIERYDLATQAKQVFIDNDIDNPRFLGVQLMFNMEREGLPTVHITLPSEQTQTGGNGIGSDEGYLEDIIIEEIVDSDDNVTTPYRRNSVYTRRFQSTYNIVITSDNSNEVILIYHTIRALLIALIPSISLSGLENVAFGGQDVQLYAGLANKNMYVRAIAVTLQYETSAPSVFDNKAFKDIFATGTVISK